CLVEHLSGGNGLRTQILGEHKIMEVEHLFQLGFEGCRVIEVLYAQGAASNLVFVSRTDTPACCTDLAVALASLAGLVDGDVIRQDQRAGGGDPQTRAHIEPDLFELADFSEQGLWRKHDAVADIASDVWMHDAG